MTNNNYKNVFVLDHPLAKHKLSIIRDKDTNHMIFRQLMHEISLLLFMQATTNLALKSKTVQTPLKTCESQGLAVTDPIIIPILRAGLSMVDAFFSLIPTARTGHIGLARDEVTKQSNQYYFKIPINHKNKPVFICDPMLATGGSAGVAISLLKEQNIKDITLVCLIAAPEGIEHLQNIHPDIPIHIAHIDDGLNENAYILPGLGDAGDRYCGT